ncbi:MAG: EAL domain-containing protein [Methylobacterium frigidaeris]
MRSRVQDEAETVIGPRSYQIFAQAIEEATSVDGHVVEHLKRFEAALQNMNQGLCMFDAQSRLVVCNDQYHRLFDLPPGTLSFGMTQEEICTLLIARGCYPPSVTLAQIRESTCIAAPHANSLPVFRELADGRILSVRYRAMEDGGWVSTFEDITEQRRSEARIAHLARHDGLTQLANSRTLRDESRRLLTDANPALPVLGVYYLDLDRFKFVNDTYGHAVGDELLRSVAQRLRASSGRTDIVGRLGGDEFAVVRRMPDPEEAELYAHHLVKWLGAPYDLSTGRVQVGVSVGLTTCRENPADIEPLLQEADLALRHAKRSGRGTVGLFEPEMSEAARLRRRLEAEFRDALTMEQFEVHYQPLIDLDGSRIVGAEALVRWRDPEGGLIPPAAFIPVAEETGLIVPLGSWVLRQACRDAAGWPPEVVVAVNVSSVQLRQGTFAGTVLETLAETGLPAGRLEIEITESALLDESETTSRNIQTLHEAGIRFAMDDFGTGYSPLAYLRQFPIDKIKIDRCFMKDAETDADALAIIRAVAGLGISLGITTLIEGVETAEQLELARAQGVRQGQGFLFSRPQPGAVISGLFGPPQPS